jgi:hypothetical protein
MADLNVRIENQINPVGDEVAALIAVVRPILHALLHALKGAVVNEAGGLEGVRLFMLPRLYRQGDGDCGICFEYAIHDAIRRGDPAILEKVNESMSRHLRVPGHETASILFGAEKAGTILLLETAENILTDDSRLLTGEQAQPPKLKRHIRTLAAAFRRPTTRAALPYSISGAWKADLFLGMRDSDRWVATTVKINPGHLEKANGLRLGIVPSHQGADDRIRVDHARNLVVCPVPYDGAFMETFYNAWTVVQQFISADAAMPSEVALPRPAQRQVARMLADRRQFPIVDVIDALAPLAQPELLDTHEAVEDVVELPPQADALAGEEEATVDTVIAPVSRGV